MASWVKILIWALSENLPTRIPADAHCQAGELWNR